MEPLSASSPWKKDFFSPWSVKVNNKVTRKARKQVLKRKWQLTGTMQGPIARSIDEIDLLIGSYAIMQFRPSKREESDHWAWTGYALSTHRVIWYLTISAYTDHPFKIIATPPRLSHQVQYPLKTLPPASHLQSHPNCCSTRRTSPHAHCHEISGSKDVGHKWVWILLDFHLACSQ